MKYLILIGLFYLLLVIISGISRGFTGWALGVSYTQGSTTFGCNWNSMWKR